MGWWRLLISLVSGTVAGGLSGVVGLGGGAVLPPLLSLGMRLGQHEAQGLALAALLPPVTLPAVLAYRRLGAVIDLRLVASLVAGFLVGAVAGASLAIQLPARELRWLFAVYLLVISVRMLIVRPSSEAGARGPTHRLRGLPIGFLAGLFSGLLGIGGGIIALPLLRRFAGLDRLSAQATVLAMFTPPIGLPAVIVYARERGGFEWGPLLLIALGFGLGALVGARFAGRVDVVRAARLQGLVLIAIAVLLVVR